MSEGEGARAGHAIKVAKAERERRHASRRKDRYAERDQLRDDDDAEQAGIRIRKWKHR